MTSVCGPNILFVFITFTFYMAAWIAACVTRSLYPGCHIAWVLWLSFQNFHCVDPYSVHPGEPLKTFLFSVFNCGFVAFWGGIYVNWRLDHSRVKGSSHPVARFMFCPPPLQGESCCR